MMNKGDRIAWTWTLNYFTIEQLKDIQLLIDDLIKERTNALGG